MSEDTNMVENGKSGRSGSGLQGRFAPFAMILFVVGMLYMTSRPVPPPPGWTEDLPGATRRAAELGQNVLVAFHSSGCPPCRAMDRDVLSSERVQAHLRSFVPVRIDTSKRADLARSFGVYATPTYAVMNPEGGILSVTGGYQPIDEFIRFLDGARKQDRPSLSLKVADPPNDP